MDKQELKKMLEQVQKRELHYLEAEKAIKQKEINLVETESEDNDKIAVIGYSCRFPLADNVDEFWDNLINGRDCITEIPANRWSQEGFYDPDSDVQSDTSYSKWGGFLNSINAYDLGLFHMTKQEVLSIDPQQLLAVEVAREALEYAGYGNIKNEHSNTGVFIGARSANMTLGMLSSDTKDYKAEDNRNYIIGKAPNMIASRISDFLNLKGPSMIIDTACSSSLVSIHMACKSLLAGDCSMALAGGIDLLINSDTYVGLSKSKAISPDGKCFTFDKRANGYVPGEGAGIVVLKEYKKAVACGDTIYAVIKGSAINNDGHTMGITTPDFKGQKELIRDTIKDAKVSAETITYVEAHGTGTAIGDPIEIKALSSVYGESTDKKSFCGIGSVKTNIGHLHCAAGIAGFIKVLLCLKYKMLVPTLNCQMPNKRFDFVSSPFFPVSKAVKWNKYKEKRRAAISSFGFGGTNCHIIIEESNEKDTIKQEKERYLPFILTAPDGERLNQVLIQYINFIKKNPEIRYKDAAYTVTCGREVFENRLFVTARDTTELSEQLENFLKGNANKQKLVYTHDKIRKTSGEVVVMFTGQGELYTGVGRELYETSSVFKSTIDRCSDILLPYLGQSIPDLLYNKKNETLLKNTNITQPVTFALDYALYLLWQNFKLPVAVVMGHSLGEYVAACAAGVYELEDILKIVAIRGRLMGELKGNGTMAAVIASEVEVRGFLEELNSLERMQVAIAAVNGDTNTVISGEKTVVETICEKLKQSSIKYVSLKVSHAFHSPLMEPMLKEFKEFLASVKPKRTSVKVISNVTGDFITGDDFTAEYWINHIVNTVQFDRSIKKLITEGYRYFIELGPATTLLKLTEKITAGNANVTVCSSLSRDNGDWLRLFQTMGTLFVKGVECNLYDFFRITNAKKIALPQYNYVRETIINESKSTQKTVIEESLSLFDGILSKTADYVSYFKVLNTKKDKILRDHKVGNSYVVPGVYQLKLAIAGAKRIWNKKINCLENIKFIRPINALQDKNLLLRVRVYKDSSRCFQIDRWDETANRFIQCSNGTYSFIDEEAAYKMDDLYKTEKQADIIDSKEIYKYMSRIGLVYGSYFKKLKKITLGSQRIIGDIHLEQKENLKENEIFHPGVLDAALQVISSKLYMAQSECTYVPFCISKISIFQAMTKEHYQSIVKIRNDDKQSEIVQADIELIDGERKTIMVLTDVCLKKLASNSFKVSAVGSQCHDLLYKPKWIEKSFVQYNKNWTNKSLLVFMEEDNLLHRDIMEAFKKETDNIYYILKSNQNDYGDSNVFRVIPGQYEALFSVIKILSTRNISPDYVLYLWTLDGYAGITQTFKLIDIKINSYGLDIINLLKAFKENQIKHKSRFLTVTNNCQPVIGGKEVLFPEKSDILGVIKTIPFEFEEISAANIDFDCQDFRQSNIAKSILKELFYTDSEQFVGYRGNKRFVMRFEKIKLSRQNTRNGLILKQNGTYIILGGQGGVGTEIIQHLSEKVHANFVVISRSKFPEVTTWGKYQKDEALVSESTKEKIKIYKEVLARGSHLSFYEGDITDYDRMQSIFEDIRYKYGAINGVIHSAGVLKDSLILNMDREKYNEVLKPKVLGAIIADRLTEQDPIDFMILFSGLVSYVGLMGQSNHTAANFFEDNFTYYRNYVKQRRTLTINWGIWGTVGIVAKPMYTRSLEDKGFTPMNVLEALEAFDTVIETDLPQVGVGHISEKKQEEILYEKTDNHDTWTDENYVNSICRYNCELNQLLTQVDENHEVDFGKDLNRLCGVFIMEYLEGNRIFIKEGEAYSLNEIIRECKILPKYNKLMDAMLAFVIKEGFVEKDKRGFTRSYSKSSADFHKLYTGFMEKYKDEEIYAIILNNCFKAYGEVLSGRLNAMHVLFPGGNTGIMEKLYHLPSPHNEYIGKLVRQIVTSSREKRKVKILEIGGGTGGTTAKILPEIVGLNVTYTFTDISPVLVTCAREAFYNYEFITYIPFDIEKEPEVQNPNLDSYDIIIAANVLHATKSLPTTFQNVKKVMNKDAVVVMLETTRITGFADLVFGLTDGWWKFEHTDFRKDSALLTPDKWRETLSQLGFGRVSTLPLTDRESVRYPYSIIIADKIEMVDSTGNVVESKADLEKISTTIINKKPETIVKNNIEVKPNVSIKEKELLLYVKNSIISLINKIAGMDMSLIIPDIGFLEMGLDSLTLVALSGVIEKEMDINLYPTVFFEYQTIDDLAKHICEKHYEKILTYVNTKQFVNTTNEKALPSVDRNHNSEADRFKETINDTAKEEVKRESCLETAKEETERARYLETTGRLETTNSHSGNEDIAIIGMSGVFPGAEDVYQLWDNLVNGIDSVQDMNEQRWKDLNIFDEIPSKGKTYCKWGGLLEGYNKFDPGFFNISVREAKRMDPQQRLFLETAFRAVENGGYPIKRLSKSRVGVFAGVSNHNYHSISYDQNDSFCTLSTSNAMVANRLSYFMNLTGPSLTIDTQCSSSMTALNYACRSILSGECDMAVAGGVNVMIPKEYYVLLSQVRALSADGKCKTFDNTADGFVSGEGAAVLLLKPLSEAIKDEDNIHAVIKGIFVTHDGKSSNVSAPNANSQCLAITGALNRAKVNPESLAFLEAHGTGTSLGDPVEVSALTKCFEQFTDKKAFCAIGSLKTNIGHLESAAGIAGIVKAVLAMRNRIIPPTLHFNQPNSYIDFNSTPFYVADRPVEWKSNQLMRAGISSFGMGGTNCHSILEEAPRLSYESKKSEENIPLHLFTISAKSEYSLWETMEKIGTYIEDNPSLALKDICHTMNVGRNHFAYRVAMVVNTKEKLGKLIKEVLNRKLSIESLSVHGVHYNLAPSHGGRTKNTVYYLISDRKFNSYDLQGLRQNLLFQEAFSFIEEVFTLDMNRCISYNPDEILLEGHKEIISLIVKAAMANILIHYSIRPAYIINTGKMNEVIASFFAGQTYLSEAIQKLADYYQLPIYLDRNEYDFQLPTTPVITMDEYNVNLQEEKEALKEIMIEIGSDDYYSDSMMQQAVTRNISTDVIPFLQSDVTNWFSIISLIGRVYSLGGEIDFQAFEALYNGKIIDLPNYVFDHKTYWVENKEEEKVRYQYQKEYIINGLKVGNRIVKSATEVGLAEKDGSISESYINYYKRWSKIQAGIKILGNFMVDISGRIYGNEVVIGSDLNQKKQLLILSQLLKEADSLLLVQLNYGGKEGLKSNKKYDINSLNKIQMEEIIRRFIEAAIAVKEGEFDGIQLHSAHGYLLSQSLSSKYNSRSDKFGGSIINRTEVIRSIVLGIRKAVGTKFVISVKLDMPDMDKGVDVYELVEIIRILQQESVDIIELSAGIVSKKDIEGGKVFKEYEKVLTAIKKDIPIPVIVTGGVRNLNEIERLLTNYKTDFVGFGRPFICEPHYLQDMNTGTVLKTGCTSCSMCYYTLSQGALRCVHDVKGKDILSLPYQEYLFEQSWVESDTKNQERVQDTFQGVYAVFCEDELKFEILSKYLETRGCSVYRIKTGFGFLEKEKICTINYANETDYIKLVKHLWDKFGQAMKGFIHVAFCSNRESASMDLPKDAAVFIQMYLAKAMLLSKVDTIFKLIGVTINAVAVAKDNLVNPEQTLLNGLNCIIPYEVKNIQCLSLDIDEKTGTEMIAELLLSELSGFNSRYKEVAFRNNHRYERRITEYKGAFDSKSYVIKEGVYLITGGLSGLGKLFAEYFIRNNAKAVYLIGRRSLNQISQGKEIEKLKELKELSGKYSHTSIEYRSADVSDYDILNEIIKEMTGKYKKIQGIIHCAGVVDSNNRTLRAKNYDSFYRILKPKYQGTLCLSKVFKQTLPDFMILCSSIAGTSGKLGATLSDYGTANFFMNEYANVLSNATDRKVVSISWPLWDGVGLGAQKAYGGDGYSIDRELGLKIFDAVIRTKECRNLVVLNPQNTEFTEDYKSVEEVAASIQKDDNTTKEAIVKDINTGNTVIITEENSNKVKEFLKSLFVEFLQMEPSQIRDEAEFYEYGIDSVIVADIVAKIEEKYKIFLHPSILLEHTSIKSLSKFLIEEFKIIDETNTDELGDEMTSYSEERKYYLKDIENHKDFLEESEDNDKFTSTRLDSLLDEIYEGDITVEEALNIYEKEV